MLESTKSGEDQRSGTSPGRIFRFESRDDFFGATPTEHQPGDDRGVILSESRQDGNHDKECSEKYFLGKHGVIPHENTADENHNTRLLRAFIFSN